MTADRTTEDPRVLVVTVSEYFYIPRFLDGLLASTTFDVVGIVTVPPSLGTTSMPTFLARLVRVFGVRVFLEHATFYAKYFALDGIFRLTGRGEPYSPRTLAAAYDIPHRHVTDVNAASTKAYVRSAAPDILVSVAATQRFDGELLDVPARCAINVHSSLLPEYRGVSPGFWALHNGEEATGITVHYMDETIDTGDIIRQERLEINDDETLHTLNTRVADRGSDVLLEALRSVADGSVDPTPIDAEAGSYYSMPTRADVREFLDAGNRFY